MSDDRTDDLADGVAAEPEFTLAYPQARPMPYGSSPYAPISVSSTPISDAPRRALIEAADIWTALLGTIAVIVLGVLAGFVWYWLAPRAGTISTAKGEIDFANPDTKAFVGADVTFLFVGLVAGLASGLVAAIVARHRGLAVSVAMAAGGTIASLQAAFIGRALSGGPQAHWAAHVPAGTHRYFIELATRQFIVGWPVAALAVTFVVGLLTPDRPIEVVPSEPAPAEPVVHP